VAELTGGRVAVFIEVDGSNGGVVYPVKEGGVSCVWSWRKGTDGTGYGVGTRSCDQLWGVRWHHGGLMAYHGDDGG
jgi:hypothetical protein